MLIIVALSSFHFLLSAPKALEVQLVYGCQPLWTVEQREKRFYIVQFCNFINLLFSLFSTNSFSLAFLCYWNCV